MQSTHEAKSSWKVGHRVTETARCQRNDRRALRVRTMTVAGLLVLLAPPRTARADDYGLANVLAGPIIGLQFGGDRPSGGMVGLEGGVGVGPERLNLGLTRRAQESFAYIELDPWYFVGASLGVGVGSRSGTRPVLGLWEGLPVAPDSDASCTSGGPLFTISVGYRYTGVHELYLAPKVGLIGQYGPCIH